MHRYLLTAINGDNVVLRKLFKTRAAAIKRMEKILNCGGEEVLTELFRDKRHHQQEFICDQGFKFLIYRV